MFFWGLGTHFWTQNIYSGIIWAIWGVWGQKFTIFDYYANEMIKITFSNITNIFYISIDVFWVNELNSDIDDIDSAIIIII